MPRQRKKKSEPGINKTYRGFEGCSHLSLDDTVNSWIDFSRKSECCGRRILDAPHEKVVSLINVVQEAKAVPVSLYFPGNESAVCIGNGGQGDHEKTHRPHDQGH